MIAVRTDRDALIIVDQQLDFEPGGALAVAGGDEIAAGIDRVASLFREVVLTQDHHPSGHVSFAGSYEGRAPFTAITLDDVRRGDVRLASDAFTLEELGAYLAATRDGVQALWPDHCVAGTLGETIDPLIDQARATLILRKGHRAAVDSYSAFRENDGATTGLAEWLKARGIARVFVAGLAGDYCVLATACDGAGAGFEVIYLEDLTRFVGIPEGSVAAAYDRLRAAGVVVAASGDLAGM